MIPTDYLQRVDRRLLPDVGRWFSAHLFFLTSLIISDGRILISKVIFFGDVTALKVVSGGLNSR